MDELKPCPFCAHDVRDSLYFESDGVGYVTCKNCISSTYTFDEWNDRPLEDGFRDALEKVSSALKREIETSAEWERQYNHRQELDQGIEDALRADLETAVTALKWYADQENWKAKVTRTPVICNSYGTFFEPSNMINDDGETARAALEKIAQK